MRKRVAKKVLGRMNSIGRNFLIYRDATADRAITRGLKSDALYAEASKSLSIVTIVRFHEWMIGTRRVIAAMHAAVDAMNASVLECMESCRAQ